MWRRAAGFVATTAGILDSFAAAHGPRSGTRVIPNGTDVPSGRGFPGLAGEAPPRIVYAGQLYPWKGVDVLVRAMAVVPDARLVILGGLRGEADERRIAALVESQGLVSRTEMPGTVPPAQVADELRRAAVVVAPFLHTAMSERHTSPLKAFEAMAAGRPLVASDLPASREFLRHEQNALLVPAGDAPALAGGGAPAARRASSRGAPRAHRVRGGAALFVGRPRRIAARPVRRGALVTPRRALVVLFVITLPLVTLRVRGADEIEYFSYLRSLAFDRDVDFANEYAYFVDRDPSGLAGFRATFLERREAATGRPINFASLGPALLWAPFYAVAHVAVQVARGLGSTVPADGFAWPYAAAAAYGSAVYGFLGLLLARDALVRDGRFGEPASALAVGALWLGTPVLYYLTLAPAFSHGCALFAVSLMLWLWLRAVRRDGPMADWVLVGLAGGLAGLVREQDALYLVVPGAWVAWNAVRSRDLARASGRLLAMGAAAALVFVPQLLAYRALNGRFGPSTLVTRKLDPLSPHFLQVLAEPGHGLFVWAPLLAFAAAGLVWRAWSRDATAVLLSLGLLLQIWINGAVESWSQAGAFGSRRFLSATPVFAWGLAALLAAALPRVRTAAVAAVLGVFVWWNVSLMVQFGLKLMDRQRLDWPRVAVNQVREVPPRLARVAWLFLTDRERLVREGV